MATILALGLDPRAVSPGAIPGLTPDLVHAYIAAQLDRVRALGHSVEPCLVDTDAGAAESELRRKLEETEFDCVLVGAGLRAPEHLQLFEQLLNTIHRCATHASICFNTTPADSAEAVQRWV
ncbi:MAG TPA: hypothetical protein VFZ95_03895 [Steroidobacteraceae bacterium]